LAKESSLRLRLPSLRSRTGRRRALAGVAGVVFAAAGLAACNIPPPSQPPKVILYGDSLSVEASPYFKDRLESGGIAQAVVRAGLGTAICDWFDEMEADLQNIRPTAVLVEFTLHPERDCIGGQDVWAKYLADAQRVIQIFNSQGVHTYFVAPPKQIPGGSNGTPESPDDLRTFYFTVAAQNSVRMADAGHALFNFGTGEFTRTLPCASHEGAGQGCQNGQVKVRNDDGLHFCPTGSSPENCAGYNGYVPGAWRFGSSMAGIVGSDLGLL
jgi:hypothetical protein